MATQKINLTRDQLATFLKNHEQIKQFEKLFQVVDEVSPSTDTTGISIQAGNAEATANEAISIALNSEQTAQSVPTNPQDNFVSTDYVDLNIAAHVDRIRRIAWNETDKTADIGMDYGVVQQVGLEYYARVQNTTGSTIPNGSVVGFAGATTNGLLVSPYLADGTSPTLYILGVMTHDLPDSGQKGYATVWGFVRGIDTSSFLDGDILYASPTVAGKFTNVKPTAPDNVIPIATCIVSDATNGVIFVRPTIQQMQYYGQFSRNTDTSPAATNTGYAIQLTTTNISNGVVIGTPASRIVVPQSGLYVVSAQMQLSSGSASDKNIWFWVRKNGSDIANSARIVTISNNNAYAPISIDETVSLDANDYIEIMWASDSTAVTLDAVASTAFAPAAPAMVLSVTQAQQ